MKEYNPGDLIEFHERSGKEIGIIIRVVRDCDYDDFGVHVRFPDDDMSYHYYFNELIYLFLVTSSGFFSFFFAFRTSPFRFSNNSSVRSSVVLVSKT